MISQTSWDSIAIFIWDVQAVFQLYNDFFSEIVVPMASCTSLAHCSSLWTNSLLDDLIMQGLMRKDKSSPFVSETDSFFFLEGDTFLISSKWLRYLRFQVSSSRRSVQHCSIRTFGTWDPILSHCCERLRCRDTSRRNSDGSPSSTGWVWVLHDTCERSHAKCFHRCHFKYGWLRCIRLVWYRQHWWQSRYTWSESQHRSFHIVLWGHDRGRTKMARSKL